MQRRKSSVVLSCGKLRRFPGRVVIEHTGKIGQIIGQPAQKQCRKRHPERPSGRGRVFFGSGGSASRSLRQQEEQAPCRGSTGKTRRQQQQSATLHRSGTIQPRPQQLAKGENQPERQRKPQKPPVFLRKDGFSSRPQQPGQQQHPRRMGRVYPPVQQTGQQADSRQRADRCSRSGRFHRLHSIFPSRSFAISRARAISCPARSPSMRRGAFPFSNSAPTA